MSFSSIGMSGPIPVDVVLRRLRAGLGPLPITARAPRRQVAAAALTAAHRTLFGIEPDHVIFASSPFAGAYTVGLVQLLHNDALGLQRALTDVDLESEVPARVLADVREQFAVSPHPPRRALPLARAESPEGSLWATLYEVAEAVVGVEAMQAYHWETYTLERLRWDRAVQTQLHREIPRSWMEFEFLNSSTESAHARLIGILSDLGVPGLQAWEPFVTASDLVDDYWMRPGYVVICDPACEQYETNESGGIAHTIRWSDGWTVRVSFDS